MPTGRIERWQVVFRLARSAIEYIDRLAVEEGVVLRDGKPNRSEMIRLLLAFALRNWKRGWRP